MLEMLNDVFRDVKDDHAVDTCSMNVEASKIYDYMEKSRDISTLKMVMVKFDAMLYAVRTERRSCSNDNIYFIDDHEVGLVVKEDGDEENML